jgi:cation:H+ antiporter
MNSTFYNLVGLGGPLGAPHVFAVGVALAGLWLGSEIVTNSARVLALRLGVSTLVIGLTVVSIASSLPEIFVNVSTVVRGADDVAAGNIVGSCFVQISLVLGLCVLIARNLSMNRSELYRDGSCVIAANLAFIMVASDGRVTFAEAVVLVGLYAAYLVLVIWSVRSAASEPVDDLGQVGVSRSAGAFAFKGASGIAFHAVVVAVGVGLVWLMATLLVEVGKAYGQWIGTSDAVIGIWVGVGTTIPELVISIAALFRKASGISIGNLIGSNITDPLLSFVIGVLVASRPVGVSGVLFNTAMIRLAVTIAVVVVFYVKGRLGRLSGLALIASYIVEQVYLMTA